MSGIKLPGTLSSHGAALYGKGQIALSSLMASCYWFMVSALLVLSMTTYHL